MLLTFMTVHVFQFRFADVVDAKTSVKESPLAAQGTALAMTPPTSLAVLKSVLTLALWLLTFMSVQLFQFRFPVTVQFWHPGWLFNLTFFRTVNKHVPARVHDYRVQHGSTSTSDREWRPVVDARNSLEVSPVAVHASFPWDDGYRKARTP